jgi:hypothetical protein
VNSGRTPQRIGSHDPFDQPTNLDSGRRSATSSWVHPGQACPELAKALPLPPDDCIGLYVAQRSAPAVPEQRQPDPEEAIEGNQHRSLPFSLEGGELQAESGVLHRNGSMTAHEETNESKDTQKDDWHASRIICLHPVPSQPVTGRRNIGEQHPKLEKPTVLTAEESLRFRARSLIKAFNGPFGRIVAGLIAEGQSEPAVLQEFFDRWISPRRNATITDLQRGKDAGELRSETEPELLNDAIFDAIYYRMLLRSGPLTRRFGEDLVEQIILGHRSGNARS